MDTAYEELIQEAKKSPVPSGTTWESMASLRMS